VRDTWRETLDQPPPHAYDAKVTTTPDLDELGAEKYLLLTTFRSTGERVPTPVWVGLDGDALVVTTGPNLGKVKRIRNNARIELTPCDVRGNPVAGAVVTEARAQVFDDDASRSILNGIFEKKYGLQFKAIRAAARLRGRANDSVVLRITLDGGVRG